MNHKLYRSFTMRILLRSITLTALVLALSVNLNAQQRFNNPDRPRGDRQMQMQNMLGDQGAHHQRLISMLDLSDEQKEQIQSIHLNGQKEMLTLRTTLQQKRAELRTLTIGDNYDKGKVAQLAEEIGDLHTQMLTKRTTHQQQIKEVLTEEQRIKFDTFHMNKMGRKGMNRCSRWNR